MIQLTQEKVEFWFEFCNLNLRWGFLYTVWPLVSFNDHHKHKTKQQTNMYKRKSYHLVTFKPGLALTIFRKIQPCFQQVKLTWPAIGKKTSTWSAVNFKMSSKPEPAIWSRDTGQRISWYDSFQLKISKIYAVIDHFTVVSLVTWPLNGSEAGVDLVLIQTSLLLLQIKLLC